MSANIIKVENEVKNIVAVSTTNKVVNQQYGVVIESTSELLAIVQESEPTSGVEGQIWFQPVTQIMSVYTSGVWKPEFSDDGYF